MKLWKGSNAEDEGDIEVVEGCENIPTLSIPPPPEDRRGRHEREEDCFGVPRPWFLPFVGVALVLFGLFSLLEAFVPNLPSAWPLILIIFGILIVVAAITRPRR